VCSCRHWEIKHCSGLVLQPGRGRSIRGQSQGPRATRRLTSWTCRDQRAKFRLPAVAQCSPSDTYATSAITGSGPTGHGWALRMDANKRRSVLSVQPIAQRVVQVKFPPICSGRLIRAAGVRPCDARCGHRLNAKAHV